MIYSSLIAQPKIQINSINQFVTELDSIVHISVNPKINNELNKFWYELKGQKQIPFISRDSVCFLYRGIADTVSWAGDFSSWSPNNPAFQGKKIDSSDIWFCKTSFPLKARLDYKIVVDGKWILDENNSNTQLSGVGSVNSVLKMPEWEFPKDIVYNSEITHGQFLSYDSLYSKNLNYFIYYRVYLPVGYEDLSGLPSIYLTDGQEYSNPDLGGMINVLDNLIYQKRIKPVIAVFVDPRMHLDYGKNLRAEQYTMNNDFADFFKYDLVPLIDAKFKTKKSPVARAILGTSLGGINSAYFGFYLKDIFHLIGINSPAFWYKHEIFNVYEYSDKLPLKIIMTTGTINDTQAGALQMKNILTKKGYELKYIEVPEGHSWGNWRALLDDVLIYFFGI